jgi:hypothetical protein
MWVGKNCGNIGDWGIFPNYNPIFLCKINLMEVLFAMVSVVVLILLKLKQNVLKA